MPRAESIIVQRGGNGGPALARRPHGASQSCRPAVVLILAGVLLAHVPPALNRLRRQVGRAAQREDEGHIVRQPVELGDQQHGPQRLAGSDGPPQLEPLVVLARLDVGELRNNISPATQKEGHAGALGGQAQARVALAGGRDVIVCDVLVGGGWVFHESLLWFEGQFCEILNFTDERLQNVK